MNKLLRNPDPAGVEATGGAEGIFGDQVEQQEQIAAPAPAPVAQSSGLSKDDMAEILRNANIGQQAAPQQEKGISPEEFDRTFNVTRADEKLFRDVFGIDPDSHVSPERVAAFNNYCQGLVKQAVTMSAFQTQAVEGRMQQHVNPAVEYARMQQHEKLKTEFFDTNKDLKSYEPLVAEVYQKLSATGYKGSKEEVFKTIAEQTRVILKSLPGDLLGAGSGNTVSQNQPSKPAHKMSTVSAGGQSGAGGRQSSPKTGPAAIFG